MLIDDLIDVGLVPVAVIPQLKEWHIVTDFCIGSEGAVGSVCIFSEVPMEEIKRVILDNQSRTSVILAKILLKEFWKKDVVFADATALEFRNEISGKTAGVVIGDRALEQRATSTYVYDLGEAWKAHTGLPFVFAAWIANKKLPEKFIESFNDANAFGLLSIESVLLENAHAGFDLRNYYTECISYEFDEEKKKGLKCFLEKLSQLPASTSLI
jgi:chorismate dehydratase